MKKVLSVIVSLLVTIGCFAGCGENNGNASGKEASSVSVKESNSVTETHKESGDAEALKKANTVAKIVYIAAQSRLAELVADGIVSEDYKGEHFLDLDKEPETELDKRIIKDIKDKGDYHGEIYYKVDELLKADVGLYRDIDKAYVGKYPDPNTDINTDLTWPNEATVITDSEKPVETVASTAEESSVPEKKTDEKRYIQSKESPREYFTALSYFNTDLLTWGHSDFGDEYLDTDSGLFRFTNDQDLAGNVQLAMEDGKYARFRYEGSVNPDKERSKEAAYDMFRSYIYASMEDIPLKDLDTVIDQVIEWAEAHPIQNDPGNKYKTFMIGDQPMKVWYRAAQGTSIHYGGFRCIIDLSEKKS